MVCLFHNFFLSSKHGELDQEAHEQFRENENEIEKKNDVLCHCPFLFWQLNVVTF
jgi:hypothetical protein